MRLEQRSLSNLGLTRNPSKMFQFQIQLRKYNEQKSAKEKCIKISNSKLGYFILLVIRTVCCCTCTNLDIYVKRPYLKEISHEAANGLTHSISGEVGDLHNTK